MPVGQNLWYLLEHVLLSPGNYRLLGTYHQNLLLFAVGVVGLAWGLATGTLARGKHKIEARICWGTLSFLSAGALVASPSRFQYYYPLVPFALLATCYTMADGVSWRGSGIGRGGARGTVVLVCVWILLFGGKHLVSAVEQPPEFFQANWQLGEVHGLGTRIAALAGPGKILTLAPIMALEGGCRIYPSLAMGPLAWWLSVRLPTQRAARYKIIPAYQLSEILARDPPSGILAGFEGNREDLFLRYAQDHGFQPVSLDRGAVLWLPPRPPSPAQ
jgi:hypothetical protein